MEEQQLNNFENILLDEIPGLEKHIYPRWLIVCWIFSLLITLYLIFSFLLNELPHHWQIVQKISQAEKHFQNKEFILAFRIYSDLMLKYPNYKIGKIRAAETCFALVNTDKKFFEIGLSCLNGSYSNAEIAEIEKCLPVGYRKNFRKLFKKAK